MAAFSTTSAIASVLELGCEVLVAFSTAVASKLVSVWSDGGVLGVNEARFRDTLAQRDLNCEKQPGLIVNT